MCMFFGEEARATPLEGVKHEKVNRYRSVNSSLDEAQNTSEPRIDHKHSSVRTELGYSR